MFRNNSPMLPNYSVHHFTIVTLYYSTWGIVVLRILQTHVLACVCVCSCVCVCPCSFACGNTIHLEWSFICNVQSHPQSPLFGKSWQIFTVILEIVIFLHNRGKLITLPFVWGVSSPQPWSFLNLITEKQHAGLNLLSTPVFEYFLPKMLMCPFHLSMTDLLIHRPTHQQIPRFVSRVWKHLIPFEFNLCASHSAWLFS